MPNGTKRSRDVPVAEKMKAGECWQDAAIRAVKEELGSVLPMEPQVFYNSELQMEVMASIVAVACFSDVTSMQVYCAQQQLSWQHNLTFLSQFQQMVHGPDQQLMTFRQLANGDLVTWQCCCRY